MRAEVVDVCTECAAGTVNLSRAAFARIADPRRGTVAVSYQAAVDPTLPGPLVLRIAAARRRGRLALQVINHGNRLASVAASRPGGRWRLLVPGADGYWSGPLRPGATGPGAAPGGTAGGTAAALAGGTAGPAGGTRISVRITDDAGHQVVLTGVSLRRTVLHATAWMYRTRKPAARALATAAPPASRAGTATSTGSC